MSDNKGIIGDKSKKPQQHSTPSPKEHLQDTLEPPPPPPPPPTTTFITPPPPQPPQQPPPSSHYIPLEPLNPKRPRYTPTSGQWKLLPSPSQKQLSPSTNQPSQQPQQQQLPHATASSSDTTSSPSHSPIPSVSGQETSKSETDQQQYSQQLRKGKYVSPVWKPNEMLWLARAWRIQYQGGGISGSDQGPETLDPNVVTPTAPTHLQGRGKTRAEKDKEVAEFLNKHGVNRDAKTAGTKWDNMLGEFRKVYEWERGGEREQIGKSYFRLSPYERKLHRLPASFDEEVFEELAQFMGSRIRVPQNSGSRGVSQFVLSSGGGSGDQDTPLAVVDSKGFLPPSFVDDDVPFSSSGI